ncbi:MAG TPA: ABC transporter permease [Actinomycetota bacterium]|nr:ABC transporter permease [Actinomycetota bacterium]
MKTNSRSDDVTRVSAGDVASPRRYLREAWDRRSLVGVLASRELKSNYEMNLIGFAWWLLEPLSLTLVYVVLVSVILDAGQPAFPLYILTALLSFKWLTGSLGGAMGVVRSNANLIQDLYFPRALLPVTEVVVGLAHYLVGLLIVPIFMAIYGIEPTWQLVFLPAIIAAQFLLCLGLAYPLSVWGLNYRNLPGLVGNLFRLWLYLSPALWSLERDVHNPTHRLLIKLNPLTGLFESYHGVIGVSPASDTATQHITPGWPLAYSAAFGCVALVLGGWYFIRREAQFGKML